MFAWLTERRRRRIVAEAFPARWDRFIDTNVAITRRLDRAERQRLRELVQIFLAEKNFEGCGGLELTEEMMVTIAAQACLLLLGRDHALYKDVDSILVYPGSVVPPPRARATFEVSRAPVGINTLLDGEATLHGPVVLSWDAVLAGGHEDSTRNVVIHELAHKIDMADGAIDGTPPLATKAEITEWAAVCSREFLQLRDDVELGVPTLIDAYGATNEAEFFAVATETFFLRPFELRVLHPELHALLEKFYRVDLDLAS